MAEPQPQGYLLQPGEWNNSSDEWNLAGTLSWHEPPDASIPHGLQLLPVSSNTSSWRPGKLTSQESLQPYQALEGQKS